MTGDFEMMNGSSDVLISFYLIRCSLQSCITQIPQKWQIIQKLCIFGIYDIGVTIVPESLCYNFSHMNHFLLSRLSDPQTEYLRDESNN